MRKTKHGKRAAALLLSLVLAALGGCTPAIQAEPIRIYAAKGALSMPFAALMGAEYAPMYAVTLCNTEEEVAAALLAGEADVAAVSTSRAAALYQTLSGDATMLAVTGLGAFYVLENGASAHDLAALEGRTLYRAQADEEAWRMLQSMLLQNGTTVQWETLPDADAVTARLAEAGTLALLSGADAVAALLAQPAARTALDGNALYQAQNGAPLGRYCLVARESYRAAHAEALTAFLTDYAAATAFVNGHHAKAALLIASYGMMNATAVRKTITHSQLVCLTGGEMRAAAETMLSLMPIEGGNALPPGTFYAGAQ